MRNYRIETNMQNAADARIMAQGLVGGCASRIRAAHVARVGTTVWVDVLDEDAGALEQELENDDRVLMYGAMP